MSRRYKKRTSILLPAVSIQFVKERITPIHPDGDTSLTAALALITEYWLSEFGDAMPEIEPRELDGSEGLQRVSITLNPRTMSHVNWILSDFHDSRFKLSRSLLFDHLINLTIEAAEEEQQKNAEFGEE